jgi:hypothetical protein
LAVLYIIGVTRCFVVAQEWPDMSKPQSKAEREASIDAAFQAFPPLVPGLSQPHHESFRY